MLDLHMAIGEQLARPLPAHAGRLQIQVPVGQHHFRGPPFARLQVFQRIVHQNAAAGDDDDLLADLVDIIQEMRGDHHGDPVRMPEAVHQFENLRLTFGIQAVGRLGELVVQQKEIDPLRGQPGELAILGATEEKLFRLGRDITEKSGIKVHTQKLDESSLAAALGRADVLLHCTPVGMTPDTARTLVPSKLLRPDLAVFDAVYNPRRTRLLAEAAAQGCVVVEGMEMFLGQAMVQFALWTGKPAPVEVMRQVIEARL